MKSSALYIHNTLTSLYAKALPREISGSDKIIIFSDLHIGDGSKQDDFRPNARLFSTVLREHYLQNGYHLILNGDVEELQRFSFKKIVQENQDFYDLIRSFKEKGLLTKTVGNHDLKLADIGNDRLEFPICEGIRYNSKHGTLLIFHGHQASYYFGNYNYISEFFLRAVANPLHIKNFSAAHSSTKRFKTESRVYTFSKDEGIVSVIGHTHRPLFESLSKWDQIRYNIESALRKYMDASPKKKIRLEKQIRILHDELTDHLAENDEGSIASQVYDRIVVPSVFNSGCVIAKRGMTGIEIENNQIKLVHWFYRDVSEKYTNTKKRPASQLEGTSFYRKVLKQDKLSYIFARIRLLT